jgi:drug/metabolite transporter (DMT)-like permease
MSVEADSSTDAVEPTPSSQPLVENSVHDAASGPPRQRTGLAISLRLGSVVGIAVMMATIKAAEQRGAHPVEIIFFRNVVGFLPLMMLLLVTQGWGGLRTRHPVSHLVRSLFGVAAMLTGFAGLALIPLGEFSALSFSAPLFITALSVPILGEKVGPHRWGAVACGFVGVLIMIRPDPARLSGWGTTLVLSQAVFTAFSHLAIRQLGATESSASIVFYFTLSAAVVTGVCLPFVWQTPDPRLWLLLIACGLIGGCSQILMTQSYRFAPASVVAPFDYGTLVLATALGYWLWNEKPTARVLLGAVLTVASALYILRRDLRRQ